MRRYRVNRRLKQCGICSVLLVVLLSGCARQTGKPGLRPKPKLPFGVTDVPRSGQAVRDALTAGGWALSEAGIKDVCLYMDRNFVRCAELGGSRPDVAKAFPDIAKDPNSGWNAAFEITAYQPGPHELTVQATDNNGATRDIGTISIIITK